MGWATFRFKKIRPRPNGPGGAPGGAEELTLRAEVWASGTWVPVAQTTGRQDHLERWRSAAGEQLTELLAGSWYCRYELRHHSLVVVSSATGEERRVLLPVEIEVRAARTRYRAAG